MVKSKSKEVVLILHDIRSTHNVGAIFRTADAAGVNKIYITGYTPAPLDRFGRKRQAITKASLGAEQSVAWEQGQISGVIKQLKESGFQIIALEQARDAVDYKKVKPQYPVAFILGNEITGVPQDLLSLADVVTEIPMKGKKESLNVSVALGIALFRILNIYY